MKTQVWIAIAVYVLVAILKKRLDSKMSLYTMLQIFSVTLFEKTPIDQLVGKCARIDDESPIPIQLDLLDFFSGH